MKLSKAELATLLVLFLAVVVTGLVLVTLVRQQFSTAMAVSQDVASLTTAKDAYPLAEALARRWRDDVQLSRVTAAWRRPTEAQLLSGKTNWAFYFYSPSAQQTIIVSVRGRIVQESGVSPASQAPATISPADWQIDSPQAIRDFLDHGGRQFLQTHPQSNVHLQLLASEAGQVEWSIIALSVPGEPTVQFFLNATGGLTG